MTILTRSIFRPAAALAPSLALVGLLSACVVGPNYSRPPAPTPTQFKEGPEANNWRPAEALDGIPKGKWWTVYNDPVLSALEEKVQINNQNVLEAEAVYRQSRALVAEYRSGLFPTLSANGGVTQTGNGRSSTTGVATTGVTTTGATTGLTTGTSVLGSTKTTVTTYTASLGASWAPDLWGSVRRQIESGKAAAQASAADIANAALIYQGELAADYLTLRVLDEEKRLYDEEIKSFTEALRVTRNQYNAGTIAETNVISEEALLLAAQASAQDLGVARAQNEHAIAMLIGVPPAELTIAPAPLSRLVPVAPAGVPSTLLERRPDIAAAERTMKEENALVGVQVAAYYPNVTLSGEYGFEAANLSSLFNAASTFWSVGGSAAETLLDFGLRKARVQAAKAAYDQAVATYRQTVLAAFQGVEDELAALRIYESEQKFREQAAERAHRAVEEYFNQYKAGTVDFTTVATAQATDLSDALAVLQVLQQRQIASVTLIEDLGGGWSMSDIPNSNKI